MDVFTTYLRQCLPHDHRLAEAERDLKLVRDQLRQHITRKKHLEDICAQLDCPMPPQLLQNPQPHNPAMPAPAPPPSAQASQDGLPTQPQAQAPQQQPAAADGGAQAVGDASKVPNEVLEKDWREQRLEALMYRWGETAKRTSCS